MLLKILQLKFKILFRILGELTFFGKVVLLALCAAALYAVYELSGLAPQRFQVAEELYEGSTFSNISGKIGVSSTTITRVNKCLHYGADGYRVVLERLHGKEKTQDDPAE